MGIFWHEDGKIALLQPEKVACTGERQPILRGVIVPWRQVPDMGIAELLHPTKDILQIDVAPVRLPCTFFLRFGLVFLHQDAGEPEDAVERRQQLVREGAREGVRPRPPAALTA